LKNEIRFLSAIAFNKLPTEDHFAGSCVDHYYCIMNLMSLLLLLGRILFVLIFFTTVPGNFNEQKIKSAESNGLPLASLFVPLSSVMALIGAASVLLGVYGRYGAWLLIIFLIPVSFIQHKFWIISDPMKRRMQYINFMKNISIIGGALFIAVYGTGPLSVDVLF